MSPSTNTLQVQLDTILAKLNDINLLKQYIQQLNAQVNTFQPFHYEPIA